MANVLLVDDDSAVRKLAALVLERAGYGIVPAANGVEALMVYSSYGERIDAVLTDVDMPGMSGIELVRRIHALDPAVRILVMTGRPPDGETLPAGSRTIMKPFRSDELVKAMRETLAT